jgi:hypothetical protein
MRRPNEWWQDAPPVHGIKSALGRARARRLEATLTNEEWNATLTFFERRCAYCCRKVWCLVDHVTSLDRGGGTTRNNCLPACGSCNRYKGQRTLEELILRVEIRNARNGREAQLYREITLDNLSRALAYLCEHGRPLSEPIRSGSPLRCSYRVTCNLGHEHRCRLISGHTPEQHDLLGPGEVIDGDT